MGLFGLETRFQNITFHDHFNNFLAKYYFPCHNDQNLVNVVTFLFLLGYFVVLVTINCDKKDIVAGRFLKAHLLNGFIETTQDLFGYHPTHWVFGWFQ